MANFRSLTIQSGVTTQIQNSNTLVVGNGITTLAGDLTLSAFGNLGIAANKNLSVASGTGAFDFSGGSGVFKTSTGAVTIGPGAVGVSGAATFSASGTALTVNNDATVTGALTAGSVVSASLDFAGALNIGGTNATAVNISKIGVTTIVKGDLQVDGTETVVGISTFTDSANFNGDVTFGNAATDAVTFTSRVSTDLHFVKEVNHTVDVDTSTTTDANGGNLTINAGAKNGAGTNGILTLGASGTSAVSLGANTTVSGTGTFTVAGGLTTLGAGLTQSGGAVSLTGNGASSFTTSSGALTLTSAAAATWSTAAGTLTVNGTGGLDLQTAGATRLAITDAALTVQAGVTLTTTGSGNINLPNNGSARFNIEGAPVSANVTAANLNTLTGGGNADALHTHAASGSVSVTGLTTTGVGDGYVAYVSADNVVTKAIATSLAAASVFGVNQGTSGAIVVAGAGSVFFESGLTLAAGDRAYVSATTAGMLTNVAPSTDGQVVAKFGLVVDSSTYAGTQRAKVVFLISDPVQL